MANALDNLYKNQSLIYKYILYAISVGLIVFFFPRGGKFKFDFQKGKAWQYENLYAPFDFSIRKGIEEIEAEKKELLLNKAAYYVFDQSIYNQVQKRFANDFADVFDAANYNTSEREKLFKLGEALLTSIYRIGVFRDNKITGQPYLVKNNEATLIRKHQIITIGSAAVFLDNNLDANLPKEQRTQLLNVLEGVIKANVGYDKELSDKAYADELSKVSFTRGSIPEGKLLIAKGEVVDADNFLVLDSLRSEYESEVWSRDNYYYILMGYAVLVALVLVMLLLFLKKYRPDIFENNIKVTFIFFNVLLMVFITTLVVKRMDGYVYIVPLCILPLILKNFFDARLGLFVHVLTILILGFVVPNSFEYIFLQIIAGIVTILTVSELYKRANLFISVGQITLIYILGYFAFHIIHEGNMDNIQWFTFLIFLLNGMLTLFVQPLIYLYEKLFGLVSDVSLLELSDTNSKLLKELANKAPGTFHHSLQVANLAEAAANEIGANAMLVRVGALYHDIGKMNKPTFFTENQITNVNPHDDLPPKESAKIIIDHVIQGIELARKNNLPDRVIDFIRTHHGNSLVYYFFKKQLDLEPETDEDFFRYPGPMPFSKETAILMMSDAVEAASKSLKSPTYTIINDFVEKIIQGQLKADQFINADITLKEIEMVKKVLKKKLTNIYHLRVEYPE
ncbi:phosphohydrolase [Croceivirga radicis]|uniref:Phosphohydrolase n=1 Tax=Croceivirga radicis TaxID=1929488 RepID=A0A1V6LRN3_9FLAO|nr:HDIG domain-containing metalloprotein [Croceivirga radicis]OQD42707.1 phosphohydrolase [Croceivirga radicis]